MAKRDCVDHLGNSYPSVRDMCRHYGVAFDTYYSRLHNGWTLKDTLTKSKVGGTRGRGAIKCTDHEGNVFESRIEMANYWGIDIMVLNKRQRLGWSLKRALTTPVRSVK